MPTSARLVPGARQSVDRTVPRPRRRGGLYIRPGPGASTKPSVFQIRSGRTMRAPTGCAFGDGAFDVDTGRADVGIGPYGVRSSMVHPTHRCARADIKSAPTDPPPGFLVGAACMAARTGSRLPPGFDGFLRRGRCPHRPAWFRVQGSPSTAPSPVHAVGADYISAQDRVHRPSPVYFKSVPDARCAPLRGVRSAMVLLMSIPGGPMWASAPTECGRRWCIRHTGARGRI